MTGARECSSSVQGDPHLLSRDGREVPNIDTARLQASFGVCRYEFWDEIRADGQLFPCEVEKGRELLSALHLGIRLAEFIEELDL